MKPKRKTEGHISYFFLAAFLLIAGIASGGAAQTTTFTYQGKLTDAGNPANGNYEMQFKLFDTPTVGTGTQQGATISNPGVAVTNGIFTVQLDFGAGVFDGTARYLEIGVRPQASPNPYTVLAPRQQVSASPYAIQTINAQQLGGLPPSRFVQFDPVGNVGIGTNFPDRNLTVQSGSGTYLNVKGDDGDHEVLLGADEAGGILSTMTNHDLQLRAGGNSTKLIIKADGNVGIGTPNPIFKLQVQGSGIIESQVKSTNERAILSLDSTLGGQNRVWSIENGLLATPGLFSIFDRTASAPRLVIDTVGNVGIGTTMPGGKLEVAGGSYGVRGFGSNYGVYGFTSSGIGVGGSSSSGTGVEGVGSSYGVSGSSSSGFGVAGGSSSGYGVAGGSNSGTGVWGHSDSAVGVLGQSVSQTGVRAISTSGNLLVGESGTPTVVRFRVANSGNVHAPAYLGLPDFAEAIHASAADRSRLEPGDVLVAASNTDRSVSKSRKPYSTSVLGVYSTAPGFVGTEHPIEGLSSDTIPMAVIGIVPCKVSAENGAIRRGDLLTTSRTPGHAMRCANPSKCIGAIVGKALSKLDRGTGLILVLVTLQ